MVQRHDKTTGWAAASGRRLGLLEDEAVAAWLQADWRYLGRVRDQHVWEGLCGHCGQPATISADERGAAAIRSELEMFGELECGPCASDRLHEFDHIARAASDAERAPFLEDAPLAGTFRSPEHEVSYREWCARRGLGPLPARPATGSVRA